MTEIAMQPAPEERTYKSRRGRRAFGLVLLVLLLLLGLASYLLLRLITPPGEKQQASTGGVTWVRSIYGMSNEVADQFKRAQVAAPAPDGGIWIVDGEKRSLMRFTPDGRFTNALRGPKDDPLMAPSRMAVGPDSKMYVCETMIDRIRVIDANNRDVGSFQIPAPVSVAVSDDRIVVGAVAGFAILDRTGKPIKVIGSRGKGDDQFDYVHGVAIGKDGKIYVVDSYNNRLSAYDENGNRLWIVRTGKPSNSAEMKGEALTVEDAADAKLKGEKALQLPLGLTLDGAGRVVVIDMFDCTLAVFNPKDGSLIGKYGEVGADDGQFFYPVSVGYDEQRDWFTVADMMNDRVEIVRIPGSSGGGATAAAVRRSLAGPLRACILPFLLLLLAVVVWLATRVRRRARANADVEQSPSSDEELAVG